jgi:hypothetical protein
MPGNEVDEILKNKYEECVKQFKNRGAGPKMEDFLIKTNCGKFSHSGGKRRSTKSKKSRKSRKSKKSRKSRKR